MGWLGKTLAFLLAIMLFGVGAWQISLLIFALLFVPPFLRARKGKAASKGDGTLRAKFPARNALGGFLLLLALVAFLAHGTFSPLVFGSLGAIVVFWGRVPRLAAGTNKPVAESILLRSSVVPVSWAAVAEVKPATRDVGRAMAGVNGSVLVSVSETTSIYVVVERTALTERSAEEAILAALRETALSVSKLGAYLLPLDSTQAHALLRRPLEASRMGGGDWSRALASGTYDLLSIRQEKGFAKSLGLFRRVDEEGGGRAGIPPSTQEFAHPPLLMEVFKVVGDRVTTWPHPDQYTAFLSSLFATSGEPLGTRVVDGGASSQGQTVVVKSQGSPSVELSRVQLRAVVRMYHRENRLREDVGIRRERITNAVPATTSITPDQSET